MVSSLTCLPQGRQASSPAALDFIVKDCQGQALPRLHSGQLRVHDSTARFVAMLAGTQSGKTVYGPWWLLREITREGAGDYLAVSANYDQFKLKMLPAITQVFTEYYQIAKYWAGDRLFEIADLEWRAEQGCYGFRVGKYTQGETRILLRSAEAKAGLEAATAKAAWLDEVGLPEFTRDAWEAVQRRLSTYQGRCLLTSSLYPGGLSWLKSDILDRARADGGSGIEVIQFDSTVNPAFPREEFERQRAMMPRWKFDMLYRGQYQKPEGLVYDCFNEDACKIARFPVPGGWHVYVGHDFGAANPAAVFLACDPATGYFYVFNTYLPGQGRSVAQHVEEFKRMTAGYNVIRRMGGSHQEEEIRQAYTAHGWPIQEPRLKGVQAQIERVYALHKLNKLFVFEDLYDYLDEVLSMSYHLDDSYLPTDKIEDEARYHLMAAERYILSDFTPETAVMRTKARVKYW